MESGLVATCSKTRSARRQLPITGSAHKAAVVGDLRVRAILTALDMAAESDRAAALDRRHHLQLAEADMTGIGLPPYRAMVAEDIRDLQNWMGHQRRASSGRLVLLVDEMIERAFDVADRIGGDLGVARRGVELGMSE
jgi:hypothetical protein